MIAKILTLTAVGGLYFSVLHFDDPLWGSIVHGVSRLLYFGFVMQALNIQATRKYFTFQFGAGKGFILFRSIAALLMKNDAITFVLLCYVSRDSFVNRYTSFWFYFVTLVLIFFGAGIKLWAFRTLGAQGYYWKDFFTHIKRENRNPGGPYKYFKNPMYTVGYLPAYGLALLCQSWPGFVAAFIDQMLILYFYKRVEKPYFEENKAIS